MSTNIIVDLSARSRVIYDSPLNLHYWELTPEDAVTFLNNPYSELEKMGISLPHQCRIETTIENHNDLCLSLSTPGEWVIICRSCGQLAEKLYKISMHVSARTPTQTDLSEKPLLHDRIEPGCRPQLSKGERSRLVSTRHGLLQSPVHLKVFAFLSPLVTLGDFPKTLKAASEDFAKIVEIVAMEVFSNSELKAGIDEVSNWVSQPIRPEYIGLYDSARRPGSTPLKTYLSVIYLRALRAVIAHTCAQAVIREEAAKLLRDLATLKTDVMRLLEKCGPNFVGHLLMETEIRAAEDPDLDRALTFAAAGFANLRPQMVTMLSNLDYGRYPNSTTASASLPYESPENYPADCVDRLQSDCARDWWGIPAQVALIMTLLQDVSIPDK
jgi:hypothetical protein